MGVPWPVGSKPKGASPYGALDMVGNVWEWVADWYAKGYDVQITRNPTGPSTGQNRVQRGGSFERDALVARSAARGSYSPDRAYPDLGFRCAMQPK